MNRVAWNGLPLEAAPASLPPDLRERIFDDLPPPVSVTPEIGELARKYLSGQITGHDYAAMQAAAFIMPRPQADHQKRRDMFRLRAAEAKADGFAIPEVFRELVETDAFVDRLRHNCIWLQMPEELWRLPSDPTRLVFLAFVEGQGCRNWHLLLAPDGSHSIVCCEHAFGVPSWWPGGRVPDHGQWIVEQCADSIEEWLFHFFRESAEHDRQYIERLRPYHPGGWNG